MCNKHSELFIVSNYLMNVTLYECKKFTCFYVLLISFAKSYGSVIFCQKSITRKLHEENIYVI